MSMSDLEVMTDGIFDYLTNCGYIILCSESAYHTIGSYDGATHMSIQKPDGWNVNVVFLTDKARFSHYYEASDRDGYDESIKHFEYCDPSFPSDLYKEIASCKPTRYGFFMRPLRWLYERYVDEHF
jgi:hypothetical protein